MPGSFKFSNRKGENIEIKYTVDIFIEKFKDQMRHKKEIDVREFLFTEDEIDEDWKNYEKIMNLKNVLKPTATYASKTTLDEASRKKDLLKLN